jgi:hypothetical protein
LASKKGLGRKKRATFWVVTIKASLAGGDSRSLFVENRGHTPVARDLPHSKQHAFNRDVINPQDGHILCDPYAAICGSLRIL